MTLSSDESRADPKGKADQLLGASGEGESPPRNPWKWSEERKRAHSEKMKGNRQAAKKKDAPPVDLGPITPDEIAMVGNWLGVAWNLVAPVAKIDPLDKEDENRLGEAAAPVLRKYAPLLGDWALEINLVMVVGALFMAKRQSWSVTHAGEIQPQDGSGRTEESAVEKAVIGA